MGVVVERIDMDEVEFRVLGEVGIVTGRVVARVKMQGAPMQENVRFTRVYRRAAAGLADGGRPGDPDRPPGGSGQGLTTLRRGK